MTQVLIIGCGDLGSAIAKRLHPNHAVIGLRQSDKLLPLGMQTIQADVTQRTLFHSFSRTLLIFSNQIRSLSILTTDRSLTL